MNYAKIYENIIKRARVRVLDPQYVEEHHIIAKCLGGTDNSSNLVKLTPEEHFICHLLLVKLYPNQPKLVYAANMMCCANGLMVRNNKRYGWLKRRVAETVSNNLKGRKSICKGTKKKLVRIEELDYYLQDGWSLGIPPRSSKTIQKFKESINKLQESKIAKYYESPQYCSICSCVLPYCSPYGQKRRARLKSNCGSTSCRSKHATAIALRKKKPPVRRKCLQCNADTLNPKFCNTLCSNLFYAVNRRRENQTLPL